MRERVGARVIRRSGHASEFEISASIVALGLLILYAAVFFYRANQLGLYVDDWDHLEGVATIPLQTLISTFPMDYRPFDELPWLVLAHLFGATLTPYYALFFVLRYLTSVFLYVFTRRLTGSSLVGFGCAGLWSVYPSDTSVYWLTTFAYRFGALFLLGAAALLVGASPLSERAAYWWAVLCCLLCLLSNELFLGLCAALPALGWLDRERTRRQRLQWSIPFEVAVVLYLAYREWIGPHILHFIDPKPPGLVLAPGTVALKLAQAGFVQLMGGWMAGAAAFTGPTSAAVVAVALVVVWLLVFAGIFMVRDRRHPPAGDEASNEAALVPPGARLVLFGLAVTAVGYVPLIFTGVPPSLGEIASRVNAAGSIGAAIFFVGIAWVTTHRPDVQPARARGVMVFMVLVLTAGAVIVQEHAARTYLSGWAAQRAFWRSTTQVIHTARAGTTIVLVAPRARGWDTVQSLPPASFQAAFGLMYPHSQVGGIVLLRQELRACGGMGLLENGVVRTVTLGPAGFRFRDTGTFVPYSQVVVLEYLRQHVPPVQLVTGMRGLNTRCEIESHPTRLTGVALTASPWLQVGVGPR